MNDLSIESALAVVRSLTLPHVLADRHGRLLGCNHATLRLFEFDAAPRDLKELCGNPDQLIAGINGALRSSGRYPVGLTAPDGSKLSASITALRASPGVRGDLVLVAIQPRAEANRSLIQLKAEIAASQQRQQNLTQENRTLRHKVESVLPGLQRLAFVDGLTGAGNKRLFDQQFVTEWHRAGREKTCLALLIVDIDHFKQFNDSYGHAAGDQCLQEVAEAIQQVCRRDTDVVCRVGGEEFAILMPDTDNAGAALLATTINATVARLSIAHPRSEHGIVTICTGAGACIPAPDDDPFAFYEQIDRALYDAKDSGRNAVCVLDAWQQRAAS